MSDKVAPTTQEAERQRPAEWTMPLEFDKESFQALVKKQLEEERKNRLPCIVVETIHDEF